jgi:hypothetical protein
VSAVSRMFVAALAAAAAGWGVRWLTDALHPIPRAALVFTAFGLVYFAVSTMLDLREARGVATRIRGIARRSR